jgi:hypothetical protein
MHAVKEYGALHAKTIRGRNRGLESQHLMM